MLREAYHQAISDLLLLQRELKRPPPRAIIPGLVRGLVKDAGLRGDPREEYFKLLATCALLGREPMYNQFKPKPRRK